ncbi:MAG: winged helix-turn-helix transcriptional regulator [Pseudomonadota bacterium]
MNNKNPEDAHLLGLLRAIEARSDVTQRGLAGQMGVALGLANSYLKRCVRKGLVKIHQAPANRYLYYLTPKGFAEKSRLTAEYLSFSFSYYRQASESCASAFSYCVDRHWRQIALCGASDLAEIACARALEHDVEIKYVFDAGATGKRFLSHPLVSRIDTSEAVDAWLLTDLTDPQATNDWLRSKVDAERVVVPTILGIGKAA